MKIKKHLLIVASILLFAPWGCKKTEPEQFADEQEVNQSQEKPEEPKPGNNQQKPNEREPGDDRVISVPDPIFEKVLAPYDSDKTINGQVLYGDIKNIDSLYIRSANINPFGGTRDTTMSASDLTGIEHFTNLKSLIVDTSKMPVLDLTKNDNLEYLDCSGYYKSEVYYRSLKELKLSESDKLKTLICNYTWLEELLLEGFPNLEGLSIMTSEKLLNVKVDKNRNLKFLLGNDRADPMDLSHNEKLKFLSGTMKINQKTLENKPDLEEVYIASTDKELNFCKNPKIKFIWVRSDVLTKLTVPAGIREKDMDILSRLDVAVSRCQ